ncbi:MAG: SDR family oxidoreductase [Pseudomonadota bacterium]
MTSLSGLKVLVTGGAKGIGRSTVEELLARGARVAAIDISPFEVEGAKTRVGDVTSEADCIAAVAWAVVALEGLDALVNNAGVIVEKPLIETSVEDFDRQISVNLRGVFLMGREAAKHFSTRPESAPPARIVNLASELAHLGRVDYSPYCASKGGVVSLTRSWARELAPKVLVNAVAPGPTDTDMLKSETQYHHLVATGEGIELKRLGQPREVASAIAFLLGPDATFMTGSIVDVNGGAAMY